MTATESDLLTPAETAAIFRVSVPTLVNWESRGLLTAVPRGPGEHRRFRRADVEKILRGEGQ